MKKRELYVDIVALILIGGLLSLSAVRHFNDGYILTINTYLGFLWWLSVIILKIRIPKKARFFVAYLLILSILNIISFTAESVSLGSGSLIEYRGLYFISIGIDPISFLLLLIYLIANYPVVKELWRKIFKPSDSELLEGFERQRKFYYDKFVDCHTDEFDLIIKNFKEYPEAAQQAINEIVREKKEKK